MVETISPVVHGGRGRWLGTLALHALGATGTAVVFGAALGWIGGSLGAPWGRPGLLALAAVATLYALGTITGLRVPVPQLRRQVPDWWRTFFGRPFAAVLYGAGLGIGFLTYLSAGTLVVVAFAALASGSPGIGALVVAPFGLVRGLSAIVAWRSVTQEQSRALVDRMASTPDVTRRVTNGVVLLAIAVVALAASFRTAAGSWSTFAAALLAAVFTWAAASKIAKPARWRRALDLVPVAAGSRARGRLGGPGERGARAAPRRSGAAAGRRRLVRGVAHGVHRHARRLAAPDGRSRPLRVLRCARDRSRSGPRSRGTRCCLPSPCSWRSRARMHRRSGCPGRLRSATRSRSRSRSGALAAAALVAWRASVWLGRGERA